MEIGLLISRAVLTVEATESLREASVLMFERGVGSAVVMNEGKPTGLITDRDSLRAIASEVDLDSATVADFVGTKLISVSPETEVREAARIMREKGFRHLVVLDEDGDLSGVFSMRDLVVGLLQELKNASA